MVSKYVFVSDDRARIQAAEELLDPGTRLILERLGLRAGWQCLEVGAGGGSIAAWLAERVGAGGRVVATDLDVRSLVDLPGVEARQHDITRDPLEESAFDVVHARLVLEHLPARAAALQRLVRAVRPGGWLMLESVDYISAVPVSELGSAEHARSQAVRLAEFKHSGVDFEFGRRLPSVLIGAGLEDVDNEGRAWLMRGGSPGARWFKLSMEHLRARLVGPGKLTDREVDRMLELFDDPEWSAMSPIIMAAWGRRGA
jgi:SAM-dependent methyltransferase